MLERSKIYGFLENRSLTGVQYGATYAYIGNAFDPAMGFELRNNNHQYKLTGGYGWKGKEDNRFQLHRVFADSEIFKNLEDGKNDSEKHGITWYFETNNAATFNFNFSNYKEFIREEFDLYGSTVLPGSYNYYGGELTAISKSAGKYYVESYAYLDSFLMELVTHRI